MTDEMSDSARRYLAPPPGSFWRWTDDGEVISWTDGVTITFRPELLRVLDRLAPQGLPPLSSVVLLLAATRPSWPQAYSVEGALNLWRLRWYAWLDMGQLGQLVESLQTVHRLDPQLMQDPAARAVLAEIVFAAFSQRTTPQEASEIVAGLGGGGELPSGQLDQDPPRCARHAPEMLRQLQGLRKGLAAVDAQRLHLRLKTGLDRLPSASELELPLSQQVRRLLSDLNQDEQWSGFAQLTRDLMAAVTLPRAISDHDELPIGGVSDISNRGPLDRLLLSELAHDDLTLALRVAVNEALYLRRESPPRQCGERALLLECGIRGWGTPRWFAAAVALAMAATTDARTQLIVYRAQGDVIVPVDLTTRAGLIEHLQALESDLHPGAALPAFHASLAQRDSADTPVIVTTDGVWADPEFQRSLRASELLPVVMASVDGRGGLRLAEQNQRGARLIREAQLSLEGLRDERPLAPAATARRAAPDELPAILSVQPFPLLLPHSLERSQWLPASGNHALALTSDRRLMLWTDAGRGAQQIAEGVPGGTLWWSSQDPAGGLARAIVGSPDRLHLLEIDIARRRCRSQPRPTDYPVKAICEHNGFLLAISRHHVELLHASGDVAGQVAGSTRLIPTPLTWRRARFFHCTSNVWHALSFDGRQVRFEPVLNENAMEFSLLTMFELPGVDGPIGVTRRGDLWFSASGLLQEIRSRLYGDPQTADVWESSHRVVLSRQHGRREIVDVLTGSIDVAWGNPEAVRRRLEHPQSQTRSVRRRFRQIFVDDRGTLTLTTRRHSQVHIAYDARLDRIVLRGGAAGRERPPAEVTVRNFGRTSTPSHVGYRLLAARWRDGSCAWLDSRGLLHLKSADPRVPETSLVLDDQELSGWCSDGRLWGSTFFTGQATNADQREVYVSAIEAFTRRLS